MTFNFGFLYVVLLLSVIYLLHGFPLIYSIGNFLISVFVCLSTAISSSWPWFIPHPSLLVFNFLIAFPDFYIIIWFLLTYCFTGLCISLSLFICCSSVIVSSLFLLWEYLSRSPVSPSYCEEPSKKWFMLFGFKHSVQVGSVHWNAAFPSLSFHICLFDGLKKNIFSYLCLSAWLFLLTASAFLVVSPLLLWFCDYFFSFFDL